MLDLDVKKTALVVLDLQKGLSGNPFAPHSEEDVVKRSGELARAFRERGAGVVVVNVGWHRDFGDALRQPVDQPMHGGPPGEDWFDFLGDFHDADRDIVITKRQWGALYGTELDLQLRRRGIDTMVLTGFATNIAVESTARQAWELGYNIVVAEDACASFDADLHRFAMTSLLPLLGRVRSTAEIIAALG